MATRKAKAILMRSSLLFGKIRTIARAALVERVAVALTNADHSPIPDNYYKGSHPVVSDWAAFLATAAIDLIRAEVLEEAARVALDEYRRSSSGEEIAAAIRALKEER